jgi:hypothetical protein
MSSPEKLHSAENTVEVQNAAAERSSELLKQVEKSTETGSEHQTERANTARREAKEVFAREAGKEKRSGGEPGFTPLRNVSKKEREASYQATMTQIRSEMNSASRTFSKIIHAPVIEKSSEVIGSSFARPNAVLAGSSCALILVTLTYVTARTFGFQLSGFETIGAFLLGWTLGILYDYVRVMAFGRK